MTLPEPSTEVKLAYQRERNVHYLQVGTWVSLVAYVAFGVLDWLTFPSPALPVIWGIRAACVGVLFFVFVVFRVWPTWTRRWIHPISIGATLASAGGIGAMTWFHTGYSSPYYAGICLVLLASGFLFSWPPGRTIAVTAAVWLFYMAPLFLGLLPMGDPVTLISNQFFLLGTMFISVAVQVARFRAEHNELALKLRLEDLASMDDLTRVHNRRSFFAIAAEEVARARRYQRPLSAIMIDIDHFKKVNDELGHAVGDEVLRAVGQKLKATVRAQDMVGRYGGEEFAVLAPETALDAATQTLARRICASISDMEIDTSRGPLSVTVSVGVAALDARKPDLSSLLNRADEALYAAKHGGRNQVVSME